MKHLLITYFFLSLSLIGQTSEDIKQVKNIIKNTGMSNVEIKEAAKARGYSDKDINEIIENGNNSDIDIKRKNNGNILSTEDQNSNDVDIDVSNNDVFVQEKDGLIIEDKNLELIEDELSIDKKSQESRKAVSYFGYDIFKQDPALFQASSVGAVDPDYIIGPSDEIIVMLWGETQFRQVLKVDREGFVFIPEVGQVFVNGLNLSLLESKLFRVLSQSYASLNPPGIKPTTFLDVSLGNLRPLRIQVLGQVEQPGAYTVSPAATLFSSLYYFNGPTTLGSLRDIRLIRGGDQIAIIDFYDYLLTGKKPRDQKLQLDDVIFIPQRLKTVSIEGEIKRPGIYELKSNETLIDIIEMSGGLKITAYLDRAQIDRIVPFEKRAELGMDRMYTDVNLQKTLESKEGLLLQEGDRIQVFSVLDSRKNIVDLKGAVTRPGSYDLGDSLSLSKLIKKADGLLGDAYLDRVDVVRIKPDFTEELLKLDLKKVLDGIPGHDIILKSLDRVRVYGMTEMVPRTSVSISGHVKRPGKYVLQKNMTLYDLIFKAGGYVDEEYKKLTYLKRAELVRIKEDSDEKEIIPFNLESVLNKQNFASTILRSDDAVRIYSISEIEGATRYVSISGHVKRPGRYELFEKNMTLYDLLFKAGGFDDRQFKARTFMKRADLIRYNDDQITKTIIPFHLEEIVNDKNHYQNITLNPNDEIRVYPLDIFNSVKPVFINGVVKNPGNYEFKLGMSLKDLILEAGGINESTYSYRIELARVDPQKIDEDTYAEVIDLKMDNDFSLSGYNYDINNVTGKVNIERKELLLMPYDYISIRPDPFFGLQKKITVSGAVYYPGTYAILSPDETIYDIINRTGGLRPHAYAEASSFSRKEQTVRIDIKNILNRPNSRNNIEVQDGDQISIAIKPNIIQVLGEVNAPGFYKYIHRQRLRDAIAQAGGLTENALKSNIFITYPNGKAQLCNKWYNNPIIMDGTIITIGEKPEEEPFDRTQYAKELTSIFANLAQTISIIFLALRG